MRLSWIHRAVALLLLLLASPPLLAACSSGSSGSSSESETGISGTLKEYASNECKQGGQYGHRQMTLHDGAGAVLAVSPLVMIQENTGDGCIFTYDFPTASRDLAVYGFSTELLPKPTYLNQSDLAAVNWVYDFEVNSFTG